MTAPEHGTRACYARGCRRPECAAANRTAENHRRRLILYGQWHPYVDAEPARQHVRILAACGVGWQRAAKLAGISNGAMSRLVYGDGPKNRPPSRRIRPETEAAILAVRPSLEVLGATVAVDATATRRRLQALIAIGWSQPQLAARIGMNPSNFGRMLHKRGSVNAATARSVAELYDELWDCPPPENGHREKISAGRARNYAAARGWAPPVAWDDDLIADPSASPAEGWQRPARLGGEALASEARDLFRLGLNRALAAERLGVSRQAMEKALSRYREAA